MKKPLKTVLAYLPSVLCMALIFRFSAQSGEQSTVMSDKVVDMVSSDNSGSTEVMTLIVRKAAHFMEYALLGCLLFTGNRLTGGKKRRTSSCIAAAAVISALYAVTDEVHQYFVPGRACIAADAVIDSCGALAGAAAAMLVLKVFRRKDTDEKSTQQNLQ